jgi:hypothetical protein
VTDNGLSKLNRDAIGGGMMGDQASVLIGGC